MATKTLILRPTGFMYTASYVDYYPLEADTNTLHLLVSEEIPDEDATYLTATKNLIAGTGKYGFVFTRPSFNIIPTAIRVVARARTLTDGSKLLAWAATSENGGGGTIGSHALTTEYSNYVSEVETEHIETLWNNLEGSDLLDYSVSFFASGDSSKNQGEVILTQIYLIIEYESGIPDPSTSVLYLKQNGTWTPLSGTIYKKQNGTWVLSDESAFDGMTNFILQYG